MSICGEMVATWTIEHAKKMEMPYDDACIMQNKCLSSWAITGERSTQGMTVRNR